MSTWVTSTHQCVKRVCIFPAGRGPPSSGWRWAGPPPLDRSGDERIWRSSCPGKCRQSLVACRSSGRRSCRSQCRPPSGHHLRAGRGGEKGGGGRVFFIKPSFCNLWTISQTCIVSVRPKKMLQITTDIYCTQVLYVALFLYGSYCCCSQDKCYCFSSNWGKFPFNIKEILLPSSSGVDIATHTLFHHHRLVFEPSDFVLRKDVIMSLSHWLYSVESEHSVSHLYKHKGAPWQRDQVNSWCNHMDGYWVILQLCADCKFSWLKNTTVWVGVTENKVLQLMIKLNQQLSEGQKSLSQHQWQCQRLMLRRCLFVH